MSITKETVKLYWRQAWRYPWYVVGTIALLPITLLTHQFLPPLITADILQKLSSGNYNPHDLWGSFGGELVAFGLISAFGAMVGWRVVVWLSWQLEIKVQRDIQRNVFAHLLNLSTNFHANHFGGSLVSQTNKLSAAYVTMADTVLYESYTMLLAYAFTAVILWPKSPLFVVILFGLSAVYIVGSIFATRHIRVLNAKLAEASNKQTGVLADTITNVSAVKSFAAAPYETQRFAKVTEATRLAESKLINTSVQRQTIFAFVTWVIGTAALVLSVLSVVWFKADIATAFLVLSYTANIGQRLWEFTQRTLRNYNKALGDAREMVRTLHLQPEVIDTPKPAKVRITNGDIQFKDVTFAHADAKDDVLFHQLTLHIPAGRKIGLVGHSGSGKTTLTRLLLRFSDIDSGEIAIDGQNIADITQDALRRHIAYVPQEPLLFHRSLRENIAYGKPDATEDDIRGAARKAHAHEFIQRLPQGYDTEVGERGVKLSGGQRQRVAIARAILKDAPILVLDEATSALDSESEQLIQSALWELMEGRTAIVIAHRLSTIQRMDQIIVLENGAIAEQGTHAQLCKRGGIYAELWAHQSGGFIKE